MRSSQRRVGWWRGVWAAKGARYRSRIDDDGWGDQKGGGVYYTEGVGDAQAAAVNPLLLTLGFVCFFVFFIVAACWGRAGVLAWGIGER